MISRLNVQDISPAQLADLERVFFNEFGRLVKAGEHAPYAGMMAARKQLIERNQIMRTL